MEVWGNFTNLHIIFKYYFLDQITILKDLASSARNFLCPKLPIYLKILYFYRFGRERYEKNRSCYCKQYNSYRLKERSKLYLHNTSPLPKLHYRKFNLFYISTLFFVEKKLLRKNSQNASNLIFYTYIH